MKRKCFDGTTEQVIARLADMPDGRITVNKGALSTFFCIAGAFFCNGPEKCRSRATAAT